jgi:hypothetical protein
MADSSSAPSRIRYPEWQHEYESAVLELDPEKLLERVTAAETAVFNRLLAISDSSECAGERQAIANAQAILRALKKNHLGS